MSMYSPRSGIIYAQVMTNYLPFTKVSLPFGWLGNMSPHPVDQHVIAKLPDGSTDPRAYQLRTWRTTEALFQAMRFYDFEIQERIRGEKSPMGAKFAAKAQVDKMVVEQLSASDLLNMRYCLLKKVSQHPDLKMALLSTGDDIIYEDVASRRNKGSAMFWGAVLENGTLVGENHLGNIWMQIRAEELSRIEDK